MNNFKDLTGQEFNGIKTIKCVGRDKHGNALWLFRCRCGKEFVATGYKIKTGKTKSCGCYNLEKLEQMRKKYIIKHNSSRTRLYSIWCGMKRRCYKQNDKRYSCYGGRGIKICDEWKNSFIPFYQWAIKNGYKKDAKRGECTIDRVDNNGDYCPENCRWISNREQSINKRNCTYLIVNGKKMCFAEVCRFLGIPLKTAYSRKQYLKNKNPMHIFRDCKDIDKFSIKFLNNGEN